MRGTRDALRSVKRYLDLVLNEGPPPLGEVYWSPPGGGPKTYRWTHRGMVAGCLEVGEGPWEWLKLSPRGPETAVVVGGRRWAESRLTYDPTPDLAGADLPGSGAAVADSSLPTGDEVWEVALHAERGTFDEPFCTVRMLAGGNTLARAYYYEVTQPLAVECYPVPAGDAEVSIDQATALQDLLLEGFLGRGVDKGRPRLVPLYDYDGVGMAEGVTETRRATDFLRVLDFAPRLLSEPQDPRLVRVVADLRVSWRRSARLEEALAHPASPDPSPRLKGTKIVKRVDIEQAGS